MTTHCLFAWLACAACAACSAGPLRTQLTEPLAAAERIAIVASERGPRGARLVVIDERGDRQFELVEPARTTVRDTNPAISPDRAWMVFASTRDRPLDQTSLWIVRLGVEAVPVRLTGGADAIDSHPVWTPDGRAIVFASTRGGGDFDLWRLPLERGRATAPPIALTDAPGHEVTPTIARDGTIVYAAVRTGDGQGGTTSHLEERAVDGTIRQLTLGPADSAPALAPDGETIAFARPQRRDASMDSELWRMTRTTKPTRLIDLPLTDETGPVWSLDGRYVFATSVLRGDEGRPLFSSVVFVDLAETPVRARMLKDRAGALARLTPALATTSLDADALRSDPEYLPELANIMAAAIAEQRMQR
ncbi:MAG: PD40 domain-containing protein [Deltaproteobacteria bacterium]|nr:PD40 domain-containing protein [Deltaproteobacteria bacterium]